MILVDYSQVVISGLFAQIGGHTNIELDESGVRHLILNILRSVRKKFHKDYGDLVICCDGKSSWRKSVFPYYKANRKRDREASEIDWNALFSYLNMIREELRLHFPYKVIQVDRAEADDIIGTLCHEFGTPLASSEKYLVYSTDKDFIQLQVYGNVDQFDPIRKKWIRSASPEEYLAEHIVRGDTGDGIPNILSADNCLAVGERQKALTKNRLERLRDVAGLDELTSIRYHRNKTLIDLEQTPQELKDAILAQYAEPITTGRSQLFQYFIDKKLPILMKHIQDF